jgi:RHS repeat-associated protein
MMAQLATEPRALSSPLPLAAKTSAMSVTWSGGPSYGIKAFTGREWDPEIGLYYYRARYYDPRMGRFISEDPIRFLGGVNFYAYVLDRPINAKDPNGLLAWRDVKKWYQFFKDFDDSFEQDNWRDCMIGCNVFGLLDDILVPAIATLSSRVRGALKSAAGKVMIEGAVLVWFMHCTDKCWKEYNCRHEPERQREREYWRWVGQMQMQPPVQ